jgi:hypothetical protein
MSGSIAKSFSLMANAFVYSASAFEISAFAAKASPNFVWDLAKRVLELHVAGVPESKRFSDYQCSMVI